jgi:hypothetical protein
MILCLLRREMVEIILGSWRVEEIISKNSSLQIKDER